MSCPQCVAFLKSHGVVCEDNMCDYALATRQYKKAMLRNHPDKGGDVEVTKALVHCKEKVINEQCTKNRRPITRSRSRRSTVGMSVDSYRKSRRGTRMSVDSDRKSRRGTRMSVD